MAVSFAIFATRVDAEPWAITPRLGISGDYSSNPQLRFGDASGEEHVAALVDLPLTYDSDGFEFSFRPNGRLSNSRGYSSLASNYVHIDSAAIVQSDLQSASLQANLSREAALYDLGAASPGLGVRRDSEQLSGEWTRALDERASLQLDAGWSRLQFDQPPNRLNLVDYRYLSGGPTFSYQLTERTAVNLQAAVGRYRSLNGRTDSNSENLQLGFTRALTEIWQVNASAGYSRTLDRQKVYFGPFYLGTERSTQSGAVYAVSVVRRGEHLNLSAAASRSLQPVGVSFLSRRDNINVIAGYALTERWDFSASTGWQRDAQLVLGQSVLNRRYLTMQLAASFHWTEHWTVSLHATRADLRYGPPTISTAADGVSLDLVRQFLRTEL